MCVCVRGGVCPDTYIHTNADSTVIFFIIVKFSNSDGLLSDVTFAFFPTLTYLCSLSQEEEGRRKPKRHSKRMPLPRDGHPLGAKGK